MRSVAVEDQPKGLREAWHDIEWAELLDSAKCEITWLPLRAREHEFRLREQAVIKGKQVAGGEAFFDPSESVSHLPQARDPKPTKLSGLQVAKTGMIRITDF